MGKKEINIQIGNRLQQVRESGGYSQDKFAEALNITVEHYRKLENGTYGMQSDKFSILYHRFGIDPGYLITGEARQKKTIDQILVNCGTEERNKVIRQIMEYTLKILEDNNQAEC